MYRYSIKSQLQNKYCNNSRTEKIETGEGYKYFSSLFEANS